MLPGDTALHLWVMMPPKAAATPLMPFPAQLLPASPRAGSLLHSQPRATRRDTAHQQNIKIAENI